MSPNQPRCHHNLPHLEHLQRQGPGHLHQEQGHLHQEQGLPHQVPDLLCQVPDLPRQVPSHLLLLEEGEKGWGSTLGIKMVNEIGEWQAGMIVQMKGLGG